MLYGMAIMQHLLLLSCLACFSYHIASFTGLFSLYQQD